MVGVKSKKGLAVSGAKESGCNEIIEFITLSSPSTSTHSTEVAVADMGNTLEKRCLIIKL